ncbi:MAG: HAD-IA family hydrolase [Clostridia bacterium]|nr:HAD-IA family hydrolase [Clostridia bacterium]
MYNTILFDLDGTLTDSGEGIINSIKYALRKMGVEPPDDTVLKNFIGPPLSVSFREYFSEKGIFENRVYDGIPAVLESLKSKNYTLIVATSKPEVYAGRILEHFDIAEYFDITAGSTLTEERNSKSKILEYAFKTANITDKSKAVLIGDRKHDIIGAHELGIKCIGVLYGYGTKDELTEYGADYLLDTVKDIEDFFNKGV